MCKNYVYNSGIGEAFVSIGEQVISKGFSEMVVIGTFQ